MLLKSSKSTLDLKIYLAHPDASEQIIAKKIDKVEKHSPKKKVQVVASDSEGDEAADFEKPRSSSLSSKLAASKRKSMES